MKQRYLDTIHMIRRFKLKSRFIVSFALLMLFAVLLIGIFSCYIYKIYFQNIFQIQEVTLDAYLSQMADQVDNSVYFLNEALITVSKDESVLDAIVTPKENDTDQKFMASSALRSAVANNEHFENICLYESTHQSLMISHYGTGQAEREALSSLLGYCLDKDNWVVLEETENRSCSGLVVFNGNIYLTHGFISGNEQFLGLLIAQLDRELLFAPQQSSLFETPYSLLVRSSDGDILFSDEPEELENKGESISVRSSYTGWEYMLLFPRHINASFQGYFKSVLPFLAIVLVISLLCSLVISQRFSNPIHQLLLSIERGLNRPDTGHAGADDAGSELDILQQTYHQFQSDRKLARDFIERTRPELEAKLLLDLIADRQDREEELEGTLRTLQSGLRIAGRYQCCVMQAARGADASHLVNYMVFKQLQIALSQLVRPEWATAYFLPPDADTDVFVLQYADTLTAAKLKQAQTQFMSAAQAYLDSVGGGIGLTCGNVCQRLTDLGISYNEAKDELRKTLYYAAESEAAGPVPGGEETDIRDKYFRSQLEQFSSYLSTGDLLWCENHLEQFIKELCIPDVGLETTRKWCTRILDLLVERTLDLHVDNRPQYSQHYQRLDGLGDQAEIRRFMTRETAEFFASLKKELNTRQYRLISQAKEYIQQHYSDSGLSIRQIADAIGISETYLSSLFTQYTGENLITYLNSYRVKVAKDLLANSRIIIKEIGYKAGFNTVQNFNRVFKKIAGMTPGDYRKNNWEGTSPEQNGTAKAE